MGKKLVVMAKEPRIGQVKSRLASDIGVVSAWKFYRSSLSYIVYNLAKDRRWETWLGITPGRSISNSAVWPGHCPRLAQKAGDLGQRMKSLMCMLSPGPVVLVGSDIPEITTSDIHMAFEVLGEFDAVFGPSTDGGYWLVGVKRLSPFNHIFERVRWSSSFALADTVNSLPNSWRYKLITMRSDIDSLEDLNQFNSKSIQPQGH